MITFKARDEDELEKCIDKAEVGDKIVYKGREVMKIKDTKKKKGDGDK